MLSPARSASVYKKAELNRNVDSENNHRGSSRTYVLHRTGCSQEDAAAEAAHVKFGDRKHLPHVRFTNSSSAMLRMNLPEESNSMSGCLPR